jgi:hypothetical protein
MENSAFNVAICRALSFFSVEQIKIKISFLLSIFLINRKKKENNNNNNK